MVVVHHDLAVVYGASDDALPAAGRARAVGAAAAPVHRPGDDDAPRKVEDFGAHHVVASRCVDRRARVELFELDVEADDTVATVGARREARDAPARRSAGALAHLRSRDDDLVSHLPAAALLDLQRGAIHVAIGDEARPRRHRHAVRVPVAANQHLAALEALGGGAVPVLLA